MWAVDTVAVIVLWEWTYPRRFLAPVLGRVREQSGRAVGAFPPRAAGRHGGWAGRWSVIHPTLSVRVRRVDVAFHIHAVGSVPVDRWIDKA